MTELNRIAAHAMITETAAVLRRLAVQGAEPMAADRSRRVGDAVTLRLYGDEVVGYTRDVGGVWENGIRMSDGRCVIQEVDTDGSWRVQIEQWSDRLAEDVLGSLTNRDVLAHLMEYSSRALASEALKRGIKFRRYGRFAVVESCQRSRAVASDGP